MTRTQIQLPDPLYNRLKQIAEQRDWSVADVMRMAAEHFANRFPATLDFREAWHFPILDCGGEFLTDPATSQPEMDAIAKRFAV